LRLATQEEHKGGGEGRNINGHYPRGDERESKKIVKGVGEMPENQKSGETFGGKGEEQSRMGREGENKQEAIINY